MLVVMVDAFVEPEVLDLSGSDEVCAFVQEEGLLDLEAWSIALDGEAFTVSELLDEAGLAGLKLEEGGAFTIQRDAGSGMATGRRQYEPMMIKVRTCVTVLGFTVCG